MMRRDWHRAQNQRQGGLLGALPARCCLGDRANLAVAGIGPVY
jgi:hypothetical protein